MTEPTVSIVIPHKGREQFLRATLASVAGQSGAPPLEVILVTQSDRLEEATLAFGKRLDLTVLHRPPQETIAALRNVGVRSARGATLAFLDADIELAPDWLARLLPLLEEDPDTALVSAMQRCGPQPPALERIRTGLSNAVTDARVTFLPGRNLLLGREIFDAVGGFPEHLITCEDYYFTERVAGRGGLLYTSASSYVHLGEDRSLRAMFGKEIWRGQSNLKSIRGRRVPREEWPSFLVPPAITGFAVAGVLAALAGQLWPATILLIAALLPFLAYTLRLHRLCNGDVPLVSCAAFYLCYFPARAWGTLIGSVRTLGRGIHNT